MFNNHIEVTIKKNIMAVKNQTDGKKE